MITIDEHARAYIGREAERRQSKPQTIRAGIRGGGCSGFSYFFEWSDESPRDDDLRFYAGSVELIVDPKSYVFLDGSTLSAETMMMRRGLKRENPNQMGSCGCGESVKF